MTVGEVASPEDAVLVDLDSDGRMDVVSSCEGKLKTMFVHWAPSDPADYLKASDWETEPIPVTAGTQAWMFALLVQIDQRNGIDLVVSSKGAWASVGWLQAPENPSGSFQLAIPSADRCRMGHVFNPGRYERRRIYRYSTE